MPYLFILSGTEPYLVFSLELPGYMSKKRNSEYHCYLFSVYFNLQCTHTVFNNTQQGLQHTKIMSYAFDIILGRGPFLIYTYTNTIKYSLDIPLTLVFSAVCFKTNGSDYSRFIFSVTCSPFSSNTYFNDLLFHTRLDYRYLKNLLDVSNIVSRCIMSGTLDCLTLKNFFPVLLAGMDKCRKCRGEWAYNAHGFKF